MGIWFPHWASKEVKGPTTEGVGHLATSLPLVQWRKRGSGQCGSLPQLTELARGRANIQTQACLPPKLRSFHGTTSAHTREESPILSLPSGASSAKALVSLHQNDHPQLGICGLWKDETAPRCFSLYPHPPGSTSLGILGIGDCLWSE